MSIPRKHKINSKKIEPTFMYTAIRIIIHNNLEGYLCGKCRGDKGVSVLLNKCVSCGHGNIALIFGLG